MSVSNPGVGGVCNALCLRFSFEGENHKSKSIKISEGRTLSATHIFRDWCFWVHTVPPVLESITLEGIWSTPRGRDPRTTSKNDTLRSRVPDFTPSSRLRKKYWPYTSEFLCRSKTRHYNGDAENREALGILGENHSLKNWLVPESRFCHFWAEKSEVASQNLIRGRKTKITLAPGIITDKLLFGNEVIGLPGQGLAA